MCSSDLKNDFSSEQDSAEVNDLPLSGIHRQQDAENHGYVADPDREAVCAVDQVDGVNNEYHPEYRHQDIERLREPGKRPAQRKE